MPALQTMIDGFTTAAELFALLFVAPVSAAEPSRSEPRLNPPALTTLRNAHLLSSTLDVRVLGSLADVRVSQQFRNERAETINLGGRLPPIGDYTDAVRIHRDGRTVDLLQPESGCDGDDESGHGDIDEIDDSEALYSSASGRAQLALDESIADALQLAPGEDASIEVVATLPLLRAGTAYRIALPEHAALASQALLVDQPNARFLVIVPHRAARGAARLTLRPDRATAETVDLGVLNDASIAYVIPIADRAALNALAAGAIELETRSHNGVVWSTLTAQVRTDSAYSMADAPK